MWQFPWKFRESFTIAIGLIVAGVGLELATAGTTIQPPAYPVNVIGGIVFIGVLITLFAVFRKTYFIKWLSGVPAAISAISTLAVLTLLMGFIPQNDALSPFLKVMGITHLTGSWTFLLIVLYFETILGLVLIRRLYRFTFKDISFALNHTGLWLIVFAVAFGKGDMKRLDIYIQEGKSVQHGFDAEENKHSLNYTFKLRDFNIQQYNPKVAIISASSYNIPEKYRDAMFRVEEEKTQNIGNWEVSIDTFYKYAKPKGDNYYQNKEKDAAYAAYVTVKNVQTGVENEGWISGGNYKIRPSGVRLNKKYMVSLTQPRAKKYSSDIVISTDKGTRNATVEVNKPLTIGKWKIYQQGYNEKKGRWSDYTILEIVKDPWLPVVYTGIFLLLFGAVTLFWSGRRNTKTKSKNARSL